MADTFSGKVVGVADGDTLTVLTPENKQVKIRLAGIDAPEKSQDFGQVSKKSLSDLVFGKDVDVNVESTDRYGRTVGWVSIGKKDINAVQVDKGLAWVYRKYIDVNSAYGQVLIGLEEGARSKKIGLWGGNGPVPPWSYRRAAKK